MVVGSAEDPFMAAVELIRDDDVGDGDGLVVQVRVLPRRCALLFLRLLRLSRSLKNKDKA